MMRAFLMESVFTIAHACLMLYQVRYRIQIIIFFKKKSCDIVILISKSNYKTKTYIHHIYIYYHVGGMVDGIVGMYNCY